MKKVYKIKYGKSILFQPLLFLLVMPILFWFMWPNGTWDLFVLMGAVMLAYLLPILYFNYQYWRNDVDQTVTVDLKNKTVEITKGSTTTAFSVKEVVACDFINVRPGTIVCRDHAYLRIKTSEDTFVITHLTVRPEILLDELGLPYNDVVVFFPSLVYEKINPKQQAKNQVYFEKKKKEFLDRYSSSEDRELEEVINDRGKYADYAVAAATEVISSRRSNPVNKA